jgi:hypothetical protein
MFTVHCSTHGGRVLLGARSIVEVANTAAGIELHWRCHCGERGMVLTGRRDPVRRDPVVRATGEPATGPERVAPHACEAGSAPALT